MADVMVRLEQALPLVRAVCATLNAEFHKLGFTGDVLDESALESARFSLKRDTFTGESSLEGLWTNDHGHRVGSILVHADETFFAEYDVVKPHPNDRRWFVEAVTAWGKGDTIKSESRLLPAVE